MTGTDHGAVEHTIRISARPETVWRYWTDPERICDWWGASAELDPSPGGICLVMLGGDAVMRGEFVELTPVIINRPTPAVSAYAADPANASAWYVNTESAQWKTPPPLRAGAQIAFAAHFLGRRLEYTTAAPSATTAIPSQMNPLRSM